MWLGNLGNELHHPDAFRKAYRRDYRADVLTAKRGRIVAC